MDARRVLDLGIGTDEIARRVLTASTTNFVGSRKPSSSQPSYGWEKDLAVIRATMKSDQ
jgi:hypothetical protein